MSARWVQDHVRLDERLEHDRDAIARLEEMADISLRLLLVFADQTNAIRRLLALDEPRIGLQPFSCQMADFPVGHPSQAQGIVLAPLAAIRHFGEQKPAGPCM